MVEDLSGCVAVVSGASRGIGRAIATALAAAGAQVVALARSQQALGEVCAGIRAAGGEARWLGVDISDEGQIAQAATSIQGHEGRVDMLVNCAGIGVFGPLLETTTADWERIMAVNVRGPFLLTRALAPLMGEGGCIINIASVVGVKGYVQQGAYTASKHALMGLTKVLAQELQPLGIRVHVVCPGGVDTELIGAARPDLDRSALMRPEEIAEIVLFLVRQRGMAVVDQINVRRATSAPWFD